MIRVLILCVLAHNIKCNNVTSKDVLEAYKYFESIHSNNNVVPPKDLKSVVPPQPNELLAVLHDIEPFPGLPGVKPLEELKPILDSRENSREDSTYNGSSQENADGGPTDRHEENYSRNFVNRPNRLNRRSGGKGKPKEKTSDFDKRSSTQIERSQGDKRRMLEWFNNLFAQSTTAPTTEDNLTVLRKLNNSNTNVDIKEILNKLNNILEKLNGNLENERLKANKSEAYFVMKFPVKSKSSSDLRRRKRDLQESDYVSVNDTRSNEENETLNDLTVINQTVRRPVNSFKSKIISHLIDSFNDIKYKIAPLTKVKEEHASSDLYKIGYIAASVDTLEENLNKLMEELDERKHEWDEDKIMDFFEKLKTSNRVLRTLMEHLEVLADKKQLFDEVKEIDK